MDPQFYFHAEEFLNSAFMLFWLGGVGCILLIAYLDRRYPNLARRLAPVFIICVAVLLLSVHFLARMTESIIISEFKSAVEGPVAVIRFRTSAGEVVLKDEGKIQEFLKLLRDSYDVSAHHSHPEKEISFTLVDRGDVYSLGKDSAVTDEYWLHLQFSAKHPVQQRRIKQFRSQGLGLWLGENITAKKPAAGHL